MSRLDLVVFGATGFTGKAAVVELTKMAKKYNLTWAVAGRSEKKLQDLMLEVSQKTGEDHTKSKIIIADVADENSLKEMCNQTNVVVNCCGPYRHYGEPVVKACVDCKTHYVDVSGEPQFIETMQLVYNKAAKDAGVYIVSACGFDSVPNDMGVIYMQQQFDGTLNSVESYLTTSLPDQYRAEAAKTGALNYGTWESLVYGIANYGELSALRKKLYPERLPTFKPKLQPRGILHKHNDKWALPFLGADGSIVYRTQRYLYEEEHKRPVQFKPYVRLGGLFTSLGAIIAGMFLFLMSKTKFTRNLLLDYPRVFSMGLVAKGPSENVTKNTYYKFELHGLGWAKGEDNETNKPTKRITVKVSGLNPGYGATVSALLYSAVAILTEKDKMPASGGVYTTGVAFAKTSLITNLQDNNMKFEIIDAKN